MDAMDEPSRPPARALTPTRAAVWAALAALPEPAFATRDEIAEAAGVHLSLVEIMCGELLAYRHAEAWTGHYRLTPSGRRQAQRIAAAAQARGADRRTGPRGDGGARW